MFLLFCGKLRGGYILNQKIMRIMLFIVLVDEGESILAYIKIQRCKSKKKIYVKFGYSQKGALHQLPLPNQLSFILLPKKNIF